MLRALTLGLGLAALHAAEADLAGLSGDRLVALLADPAQAQRAHYELWRRAVPGEDDGWKAFTRDHYGQRIVRCPQGPGLGAITLVLHGFLVPYHHEGDYPIPDPDALFPGEPAGPLGDLAEPAIDAYAADGRRIAPFGGNNVLDARSALLDLDGDGLLEHVGTSHYGIDGVATVEVLEIVRVREKAEPLFTALIDWGADEWTFAVAPPTAGRPGEVHLGPLDGSGQVRTRAVVRCGPRWELAGEPAVAHVRPIGPDGVWAQLDRLRAAPPVFPADPSSAPPARSAAASAAEADGGIAIPPEPAFAFRSLGGDARAVAAFMAKGRSIRDLEEAARLHDDIPAAVWALPPRDAALLLAESNRSPAHRQRFRLAIDGRDGAVPPQTLVLDLSHDSSRCYHDTRSILRLRAGPGGATLAMSRTEEGRTVFYDPVTVLPRSGLRLIDLDAAGARHAAEVVWWLDRVRSLDRLDQAGQGSGRSTADGRGLLRVSGGDGGRRFELAGPLWAGDVPERWSGDYGRETALNLARILLDGLFARLGTTWPEDQPEADLRATAGRLLQRPATASNGIVLRAVEAAGVQGWDDCDADLQRLAASVTPGLPALRTREQVTAEIDASRQDAGFSERTSALYAELFALDQDTAQAEQSLLAAIVIARARLAVHGDAGALAAQVREGAPDWRWAASRLHALDRAAYVAALEARLAASTGHEATALRAAIATADPARIAVLAAAPPPAQAGQADPVDVLVRAQAQPEGAPRTRALIAVLRDSGQGWTVRSQAMSALVPTHDPLRLPDGEVDLALVAVLDGEPTVEGGDYLIGSACQALARRGRHEQLGRIIARLEARADSWNRSEMLAAAVELAGPGSAPDRQRLAAWLADQLVTTNLRITDVLWAAWALDLRHLAPVIEALATASPAGVEGPMATSYGGTPRPIAGRYHLARQIAQTWRETDGAARTLLLLGLAHGDAQAWDEPARARRRLAGLAALRGDPAARRAAADWLTAWRELQPAQAVPSHLRTAVAVFGLAVGDAAP